MADEALPVDREALAEEMFHRARVNALAKIGLTEKDTPHVTWEATDQEAWLADADALIASPVLRALAETVWDEVADSCFVGAAATHVRKHNPYREQAPELLPGTTAALNRLTIRPEAGK